MLRITLRVGGVQTFRQSGINARTLGVFALLGRGVEGLCWVHSQIGGRLCRSFRSAGRHFKSERVRHPRSRVTVGVSMEQDKSSSAASPAASGHIASKV